MKLSNYTKYDFNPKFGININKFGAKNHQFSVDVDKKRFLKWDEAEATFAVYDFDKNRLWSLDMKIAYASFDTRNDWIWVVRRDNKEQITLFLYDYNGNSISFLTMKDTEGSASFIITPLPEKTAFAIDFCYGQDGTIEHHLIVQESQINPIYNPDNTERILFDKYILFDICNGNQAVALDFYENTIYKMNYPSLEIVQKYTFADDFLSGEVCKITDLLWLVSDGGVSRHYLFDADAMQIGNEIIIAGFEPYYDTDNELVSDIDIMEYYDKKLIFQCYDRTQKTKWWGVAEYII